MEIIENSNIVQWDNYPGYICAVVLSTKEDLLMTSGLIMPENTELVWLVDKVPYKDNEGDWCFYNANILPIDRYAPKREGVYPLDLLELHLKPKKSVSISCDEKETVKI